MNFRPYTVATAIDQSGAASATQPMTQTILQGPMAAYCAPKVLGLNGPGFTGADCCHPFENPTPLSEFLQLMLFFSVVAGLPYYYGRMINNTMHGWNIWLVMFLMLIGHAADHLVLRGPAQSATWRRWGSILPTPTWKARKSASASTTRPLGPTT